MSLRNHSGNSDADSTQSYTYQAFTSKYPGAQASGSNVMLNPEPQMYVKWGISWTSPGYILLCASSGVALAIAHHSYYQYLDGKITGSAYDQQWSSRIGTGFSFLIIALLKATCDEVYTQLIWVLVKRRSYKLDSVDKLFRLNRQPSGYFSWELWMTAKWAIFLSLIDVRDVTNSFSFRIMSLAAITPPSTLSVVPAVRINTRPTSWPAIDWGSRDFSNILSSIVGTSSFTNTPSSSFLQVATDTAQQMEILRIPAPSTNATYRQNFYGPTVRCSPANETQQRYFDFYTSALANESLVVATQSSFEGKKLNPPPDPSKLLRGNPFMLFFSAFTPLTTTLNAILDSGDTNNNGPARVSGSVDKFNNWLARIPGSFYADSIGTEGPHAPGMASLSDEAVQQIFVQTSNQSLVCYLGNASFAIEMAYVNGIQNVVDTTVTDFIPLLAPMASEDLFDLSTGTAYNSTTTDEFIQRNAYIAYFLALSSVLNGNITTSVSDNMDYIVGDTMTLWDSTSKVLQNGLSACEDFKHSYWDENAIALGGTKDDSIRPVVRWDEAGRTEFHNSSMGSVQTGPLTAITNHLFQKPAWMCRNRTLARAIEDLANNITISMLSSTKLATPNATIISIDYHEIRNIYQYDSRNLFISYGSATLVTVIALGIAFYSFHYNGVVHSDSFTAMLATTGNPELHNISKGHSLGALPVDKSIANVKVRFGVLRNESEDNKYGWDIHSEDRVYHSGHVGFGRVENVGRMIKGGQYT
ncbi:formylmethionine deformylase protein [Rutstroemia sp. NJR-2017a BBW]|nr:formylmethionine deformylase protein [Rutstroemia sp. NJR-2017a BBW]